MSGGQFVCFEKYGLNNGRLEMEGWHGWFRGVAEPSKLQEIQSYFEVKTVEELDDSSYIGPTTLLGNA